MTSNVAGPAARRAGTPEQLRQKNRELYDDTFGTVWRHAIYDGLHGGREFINLGGDALVAKIGDAAGLTTASHVLELGSGPGAVAARLLDRYGCTVTGVDLNPHQIGHARQMARDRNTDRLQFVEADACAWTPDRTYDAVISVDAFMLLAAPADAIQLARLALTDQGTLVIATLTAGPRLTDRFREFAVAIDGMVNLCAAERYASWISEAGFEQVAVTDITSMAVAASRAMIDSIARARNTIVAQSGPDVFEGWRRVSAAYCDALTSDQVRYELVIAHGPVVRDRSELIRKGGEDVRRSCE